MPKLRDLKWFFWAQWHKVRHPVEYYQDMRKWMARPSVGDMVTDCRGKTLKVISFGENEDDLNLEDGTSASWMHCCDRPC